MNKQIENKKNYIFSIIVLSIVLCISLIYNFLGGFDIKNIKNYQYEIGDDAILKPKGVGSEVISFAIDGTSLPGDIVKQKVEVVLPDINTTNLVMRAKFVLSETYLQIFGFNSWQLNDQDNYYYYIDEIYKNQIIGICTDIKLPDDITLKSDLVYYINFVVEIFYLDGLNA